MEDILNNQNRMVDILRPEPVAQEVRQIKEIPKYSLAELLKPTSTNEEDTKQHFADIESFGGKYDAYNKGSGAYGKYQIHPIMMEDLGVTKQDLKNPKMQESIMSDLLVKYEDRLKQFKLPITKENMFVVHNLGMTGGIRVLNGRPTDSDINNMKGQLPDKGKGLSKSEIIASYKDRYFGQEG